MKYFFFILIIVSNTTHAQQLLPGMPAPELKVSKWLKGREVQQFHPDSTYVVEFWATWCGPCKQSIPHLTELAHKYPNTNIIGVSVAEANTKYVEPYVTKMGEKMDYTVAIDDQASDTARAGFMTKNWMEPAGINSIPNAFVIANNKIAWIGYPMALDSVLAAVNNKTWNTERFAKEYKKKKADEKNFIDKMGKFKTSLAEQSKTRNKKQFYKTLDNHLSFMVDNPEKAGWPSVNEHIWYWLADPAGKALTPEMKDYKFGIKWMEKLTATSEGKNPAYFDTMAWCYYGAGNKQKAIETETAALAMLPADARGREEYEKALQTFTTP